MRWGRNNVQEGSTFTKGQAFILLQAFIGSCSSITGGRGGRHQNYHIFSEGRELDSTVTAQLNFNFG